MVFAWEYGWYGLNGSGRFYFTEDPQLTFPQRKQQTTTVVALAAAELEMWRMSGCLSLSLLNCKQKCYDLPREPIAMRTGNHHRWNGALLNNSRKQ